MNRTTRTEHGERGQVVAIFALALVAIIAMTGLVLDGGSTFVQRRDMQNVADAAAMAAAYDYVNSGSTITAELAAQAVAADNGYVDGTDGVDVTVSPGIAANGAQTFTVTVRKPHRNNFSGIVGMPTWDVSTTATAMTGAPNAAIQAMPLIFNQKIKNVPGAFKNPNNPTPGDIAFDEPGGGNEDVPQDALQFNWTIYCTANGNPCNANSNGVRTIINGGGNPTWVSVGQDIGPLNAGAHTTLFDALAAHVGKSFPVTIVDDEGNIVGFAMFHLTGSVGGSTKQIRGYFEFPINTSSMQVISGAGPGTSEFGAYAVRLID